MCYPDPGYALVSPGSHNLSVNWTPGLASTEWPNIVASEFQNRWLPADGYIWVINPPVSGDLRVRWDPGRASTKYPHLVAATTEGHWRPESGYVWVVDPPVSHDLRVESVHAQAVQVSETGNSLLDQGRAGEAEEYFRRALELTPDDATTYYNVGTSLLLQHRYDEALTFLNQATARAPWEWRFALNTGTAYWGLGRFEEAAAWYRRVAEMGCRECPAEARRALEEANQANQVTGRGTGDQAPLRDGYVDRASGGPAAQQAGAQALSAQATGGAAAGYAQAGALESASATARVPFDTAGVYAPGIDYPHISGQAPDIVSLLRHIPEQAQKDETVVALTTQYQQFDRAQIDLAKRFAEISGSNANVAARAQLVFVQSQIQSAAASKRQIEQDLKKRVEDLGMTWVLDK